MRNINIPKTRVYIRCDAFGKSDKSFEPAWLVSVRALRGRPLCFQVWVDSCAACYDKVPPHCVYWKFPENNHTSLSLSDVQLWECLSGSIEAWRKDQLADVPVMINLGKKREPIYGKYWFTLDFIPEAQGLGFLDVGDSNLLEEHKEANIIKLKNGQIAIYPNNRLKWLPPSLTSPEAVMKKPDWEVATNIAWECWDTSDAELLGNSLWAY